MLRTDEGADLIVHVPRPEHSTLAAAGSTVRVALPLSALQRFDAATGRRV